MSYWLRVEADPPPSVDMRPDGYSQGTTFLGFIAWASVVALGAWLAWG